MSSEKRREQRKRDCEMNLIAAKASFVAGIVLIITIIQDILKLFFDIPLQFTVGCSFIALVIFYLVLGTRIFDERMKSKKVSNFGNFLTIMSVIFWIIENTYFEIQGAHTPVEIILPVTIIGLVAIGGALYLLFAKYNR